VPDDTKVFDVAKPGRSAPAPTSRPIIVGQRTAGVENMMKDSPHPTPAPSLTSNTPIHVSMADEEPVNVMAKPSQPDIPSIDSTPGQNSVQEPSLSPVGATIPPHELDDKPQAPAENVPGNNFTPLTTLIPNSEGKEDTGSYGAHHVDNLPEVHNGDPGWREAPPMLISKGAGPRRRWPKVLLMLFILLFLAAAGGFLAIDGGYVKSSIKLPFHILNKQKFPGTAAATSKTTVVKTTPPVSQPPAESAVPAGFTNYKMDEAKVSFAYPTAWGVPVVTKDPGFSKRGGTNKTDGTHAFLVNFATNKDVEIALTSSQYLPATRAGNVAAWYYFDYLAWCTGTNDGKIYQQTLHFTTDNKIDTPSTITCDQGPLTTATKLDDSTIVQLKTNINDSPQLQSFKQVDLYTKNLTGNTAIPVLRAKDVTMKNSDNIKKLLATVKVDSGSSASTNSTNPITTSTTH
jgi:hypothetical protein